MVIGVPREVKEEEYRVGLTPFGVEGLVKMGCRVMVEKGAGLGSGFDDGEYRRAGALIVESHEEVFNRADLVVKVKEPVEEEYPLLREGLILFAFLHLAPNPGLAGVLMDKGVTAIAYETVELEDGTLPLLRPMSEIAGRLSVQIGATLLHRNRGGRGILLGGVPGVGHGMVTILGGGTVGYHAGRVATALGCHVSILDINVRRLETLEDLLQGRAETFFSSPGNIESLLLRSDLVIGAVLVKGGRTPILVRRDLLKGMKRGAVIVDVAIDQGGCVETSRPTTHSDPTFEEEGVIHYCVTNMPGVVPRTSTMALTNATIPYVMAIARKGLIKALGEDPSLAKGLNIFKGRVTYPTLARDLGVDYTPVEELIG